jgi:hypothetical protein
MLDFEGLGYISLFILLCYSSRVHAGDSQPSIGRIIAPPRAGISWSASPELCHGDDFFDNTIFYEFHT